MQTGVLVPAFLAASVIAARAILGKNARAPYPYEYLSWLVVYGGIGIVPDPQLAQTLAWGYLAAMVLAPGFADVVKLIESKFGAGKTGPAAPARGGSPATGSGPFHMNPATPGKAGT